jgi:hypothetical protein
MSKTEWISNYWVLNGMTHKDKQPGKTFERSDGSFGCAECCNGDRCDDGTCYYRPNCPFCLGSGTNATIKEVNR